MSDGFKHIAVTAAEEGDEVIVAGTVETPEAKPARGDGFHETTLEDLSGEKMPITQKIVIVAAIVCIIGALVYYLVAMR